MFWTTRPRLSVSCTTASRAKAADSPRSNRSSGSATISRRWFGKMSQREHARAAEPASHLVEPNPPAQHGGHCTGQAARAA